MKTYVGVVLTKSDGSVLAQLRDDNPNIDFPNQWSTVGGLRKKNETSINAAQRELEAETDYRVVEDELKPLIEDTFEKPSGEAVKRVVYWGLYDGERQIKTNEGQEIRFLSRRELGSLPNIIKIDLPILKNASEKSISKTDIEREN
jgi:ADP-ribose pyrophosphatase YjhB (NUDIX family)